MAAEKTAEKSTPLEASQKPKRTRKKKPAASAPKKTTAEPKIPAGHPAGAILRREAGGLALILVAVLVFLSVVSFNPADIQSAEAVTNLIGPLGAFIGDALLYLIGVGAFFFDGIIWYLGLCMMVGRAVEWKPVNLLGLLLFVASGAILSHLWLANYLVFGHLAGGFVGEFAGEILRSMIGTVGTAICATGLMTLSLMLVTQLSLGSLLRTVLNLANRGTSYGQHRWRVYRAYRLKLAEERRRLRGDCTGAEELEAKAVAELEARPILDEVPSYEEGFDQEVDDRVLAKMERAFRSKEKRSRPKKKGKDVPSEKNPLEKVTAEVQRDKDWELGELPKESAPQGPFEVAAASDTIVEVEDVDIVDMAEEKKTPPLTIAGEAADFGPQIVESRARKDRNNKAHLIEAVGQGVLFKPEAPGHYELPPIHFLNFENSDEDTVDPDLLRSMAAQIEKTLSDFKVDGTIVEICPGPVITMFEFRPAPGVKLSRISGLTDDLAMALSAHSVRIVAPIPGKGVVGIEVPNPTREMVYLKEILADESFAQNKKMQLPLGLGVGTAGGAVVADLARMPHLLVAGATGAGKSVAVNTMICSLLYRHTPEEVRLIMVDPKMLEFSIYERIPHLLLPVVTDPKQATVALNWAVLEMERRYQKLADMGVRNVAGYNKKIEVMTKQAELDQARGLDESDALKALGVDYQGKPEHKKLPYIVVIIDEFADLMMTAPKDVETSVARLAQKARAAGIHLILATQRPSTDVITGLIKANFPTRIALRVTSKTDSRVILDSNGAENLLGNGDMLFVPPGTSALQRVHGAYVSETEIAQVVEFLRGQGNPKYDESILVEDEEEGDSTAIDEADRDEHYSAAVQLVFETRQASISMIQRRLRVGYNRAARMVEMMEKEGLVSPAVGCKPREVLIDQVPV
jgi:DNA segregation ATPase FtsK/SpoIIIE, S-DNA-T family